MCRFCYINLDLGYSCIHHELVQRHTTPYPQIFAQKSEVSYPVYPSNMYELVKDYKETAPVDDININMPARLVRNSWHERGFKLNICIYIYFKGETLLFYQCQIN
jgi:hypothetical protein